MTEQGWLTSSDPAAMLEICADRRTVMWADGMPAGPPHVSDRKLRLLVCALCRLAWDKLPDPRSRKAVEVAERLADGEASKQERLMAEGDAINARLPDRYSMGLLAHYSLFGDDRYAARRSLDCWVELGQPKSVAAVALWELFGNPFRPTTFNPAWLTKDVLATATAAYKDRPGRVCYRCKGRGPLYADPRPTHLSTITKDCPACHGTGRVEDGALDSVALGAVADALMEAGCDSEELLRHLRGEEPLLKEIPRMTQVVGPPLYKRLWRPLRGPHFRGCWALDLILGKA